MEKETGRKKDAAHLVLLLVFVACIGVTLLVYADGISGNDFWWHVKIGEWIVQHHQVPTTAIYSWAGTEKGISWTAHEWLSEVIFYEIYVHAGEDGIFVMCMVLALLLEILLWEEAVGRGVSLQQSHSGTECYLESNICTNPLISAVFFGIFAVTVAMFCYARPHIFSYFLLFATLKILYRFWDNPHSRAIYLMPLVACLWSNLHGGSANLSYLLCLVLLVVGLVHWDYGRLQAVRLPVSALVRLAVVTVLTALAVLVNPIGLRVFVFPYTSMADSLMMSIINEWQAPDAKSVGILLMCFLPILLLCIGFVVGKGRVRLLDVAYFLVFLFLFFRSARFIMLWDIAAVFCAFRYLPPCQVTLRHRRFEQVVLAVAAAAVILLPCYAISTIMGNFFMTENIEAGIISTTISQEMLAAIRQENPKRLFNDYDLGGELIYHGIEVFFDGRAGYVRSRGHPLRWHFPDVSVPGR